MKAEPILIHPSSLLCQQKGDQNRAPGCDRNSIKSKEEGLLLHCYRREHCLPSSPHHLHLCHAGVAPKYKLSPSQYLEKRTSAPTASGSSHSTISPPCPLTSSPLPPNLETCVCPNTVCTPFWSFWISSETSYVVLISNNFLCTEDSQINSSSSGF